MALISRYRRTPLIKGMTQYGIATSANTIFHAVRLDVVPTRRVTLKERQRLDHIAGKEYGDAYNILKIDMDDLREIEFIKQISKQIVQLSTIIWTYECTH